MEKDKTFELKDSLNFNNTLKDSTMSFDQDNLQGRQNCISNERDDNFDKLRTQDDLDDEKLIIPCVEEECENENENEKTSDDLNIRRE